MQVNQMCEDVHVMEEHINAIHVLFQGLGRNFNEQDDAAEKIEKEIKGVILQSNPRFFQIRPCPVPQTYS